TYGQRLKRLHGVADRNVKGLAAVEPELVGAFAVAEAQRQHAHADQVATVDPLEALGDHRLDAQQECPFGRPVAARSGAVLVAAEHHQWGLRGDIFHRRVVDELDLPGREVGRDAALGPGRDLVADPDVGEGPSHHDLV